MTFFGWCATGVLGLLGVYLISRLASYAYFKSRDDYERKQQ